MGEENGYTKGRLTRDLICEAALEAIDENGLESVSMRGLAKSLGVKASSLYHHFRSKEDLLAGVAEFLYAKLDRPPDGGSWAEEVKATFVQLRDFIQAHPNATPLLVRDLARSPVAEKRAQALLNITGSAGLDPLRSAGLVINLVALLVGHSLLAAWLCEEVELQGGDNPGDGNGGTARQMWIHRLVPAETCESTEPALTDLFLDGLDALISGFWLDSPEFSSLLTP